MSANMAPGPEEPLTPGARVTAERTTGRQPRCPAHRRELAMAQSDAVGLSLSQSPASVTNSVSDAWIPRRDSTVQRTRVSPKFCRQCFEDRLSQFGKTDPQSKRGPLRAERPSSPILTNRCVVFVAVD